MPHKEPSEILTALKEASKKILIGGKYTHYKSPDHIYIITGLGVDEDTEEIRVEYQRINEQPAIPWRRRLVGEGGWLTPVEIEGKQVPRFNKID